ncbi:MAG TPA: DUF3631 domain-containing protein [Micropepsaceae bacterium]|nr:DUF3631 domain-containing protein [Micropepsaceae bacterium]
MDLPDTATPSSRKTDDAESARREANRALDDIAKRLGVSPQKLRRMIEQGRKREILALANRGLPPELCDPSANIDLTPPRPWPEPVLGSELLRRMSHAIAFHVHMDPYLALTAALWAMHTHDPERFERTPRLVIHSGRVTSGKTTLLSVLACLVSRPLKICAAKPDALIDALADRPTLLIDDAAALLQGNRDARTVIRNGCCRSGAQLLRKGRARPQAIDLFTPMVVAFDGDIPPVFAGRSIGIPLEPMRFGQSAGPLSPEALDNLSEMGRMAARWAADTEDDPPPEAATLAHGDDPNWQPLIAIAAAIGDEWLGRTIEAMRRARDVSATSELERLLRDIRKIIPEHRAGRRPFTGPDGKQIGDYDRIRSIDLIEALCSMEHCRWAEHGRNGQPITPHSLARILANAHIRPGLLRFHTGDENGQGLVFQDRGYLFTQFTQAFEHYLPFYVPDTHPAGGMDNYPHLRRNEGAPLAPDFSGDAVSPARSDGSETPSAAREAP